MSNLIEQKVKFYKECGVVMLDVNIKFDSTNKVFYIIKTTSDELYLTFVLDNPPTGFQHLYITSDDEIKEGDWILNINTNSIAQYNGCGSMDWWRKIIATTDTLGFVDEELSKSMGGEVQRRLPQPSDIFIHSYITAYNKGKKIEKVLVEYDRYFEGSSLGGAIIEYSYDLKLKDNKIITKYNDKEGELKKVLLEVMNLGMSLRQNQLSGHSSESGNDVLDNWIDENGELLKSFI